ncbi:hypothetical protein ABPG74_018967, partial [Tetrahymena malaccensis]
QLQIKTDKYESKKEWSKLANTFQHMQSLEDLRLYFSENRKLSTELEYAKNLSLLTNLKRLSLDLQKQNQIATQFIQEMGNQLSQLYNLELFLFSVNYLNGFEANDLLYIIKCISILQKLKFVKIQRNFLPGKITKSTLLNQIARKNRRLVVFNVEFFFRKYL